jgi:CubicO group peptidase (beta-lactamase class C family)
MPYFYCNTLLLMKYTLNIFIITIFLSCQSNTATKATPPTPNLGQPPKFGKVSIDYTDTNSPEMRKIIYSLDTFYQKRVAMGFNGQVLIGYKGKVLYERYFGVAQRDNGLMISKETPSQLASTSKPFTAMAVCLLKDRGLLRFDDYVTQYIPDFPYPNITIRNLLTHRSGLPDYLHFASGYRLPENANTLMSNEELLNIIAEKKPKLNFTPDTRFTYCNTNYAVLSYLVSKVTNMPFAQFMKYMIFDPLKMKNTYIFDASAQHHTNYCKNYKGSSWAEQKDMFLDGVSGDKGCYSTVQDMYKWDQALYSGKLIKETTLQEAYSPYSFERPGVKNYGLGWRMLQYPEQKIIFHNGYWHGCNNCFYRFLNDNFTIIILGNKYNKANYYQPLAIYKIINGGNEVVPEEELEE